MEKKSEKQNTRYIVTMHFVGPARRITFSTKMDAACLWLAGSYKSGRKYRDRLLVNMKMKLSLHFHSEWCICGTDRYRCLYKGEGAGSADATPRPPGTIERYVQSRPRQHTHGSTVRTLCKSPLSTPILVPPRLFLGRR